jgi:hypothetical protein
VKNALLVGACSALSLVAAAQSRLPPGVDGGGAHATATATRNVVHYLDLERGLADALREHRRDAAARMLAPEFEVRSAESLDGVPAATWLDAQVHAPATPTVVRDLAVREFGDLAIVSFFLDRKAPRGTATKTLYVVDVWQRSEERLAVRYESEPAHPLRAPSRPRGRD